MPFAGTDADASSNYFAMPVPVEVPISDFKKKFSVDAGQDFQASVR